MSVPIKLQLNEKDLRRIKVDPAITYAKLVDLLKALFKQVPEADWEQLNLSYIDNENDSCNITGELELREAFHAKKNEVLKLELSFRRPTRPSCQLPGFPFPLPRPQQCNPAFPPHQQRRVCWPEQQRFAFGPRRMQMMSLHDDGIALMEAKKYLEAKEAFEKQVEMTKCLWKKSTPLYNIACCEALLGNADSALAYLAQAISHGFKNVQHIEQDEDLKSLHGLDAFDVMISELKTSAASNQHCHRPWKRFQQRFAEQTANNTNDQKPSCETSVPSSTVEPTAEPVVVAAEPVAEPEPVVFVQPATAEPAVSAGEVAPSLPAAEPIAEVKTETKRFQAVKGADAYESECNALVAMGFTNVKKNTRTLMKTKGNLSEAVRLLLQ